MPPQRLRRSRQPGTDYSPRPGATHRLLRPLEFFNSSARSSVRKVLGIEWNRTFSWHNHIHRR